MTVLIAGGGIAGLTLALTCHEIGVPVKVFEAVDDLKPLGVGINLQPNCVRELFQLGLEDDLRRIGIEAEEWALFFYGAHPVWTESRGTSAGYKWPQFSVHRGQFHLCLLQKVKERLGEDSVITDARVTGYENQADGVTVQLSTLAGDHFAESGSVLIGADGIHSTIRQQMYPHQPEPHWNGAIMWRGVARAKPPRNKNAFAMVGGLKQRFISYPIEPLDANGETLLNWIAELRPDDKNSVDRSDWNKMAPASTFMPAFEDWVFDWLDVPDIVNRSGDIWEYPMIDRDPVDRWVDGRVALIGDAAHAMYPVGSGGATQAIVDTRVLGACFVEHGMTVEALDAYEARLLSPINDLVMRNRSEGPLGVLHDIEERIARGEEVETAIDPDEIAAFMARYKEAAGTARDALNASPPVIT